MLMKKLFLDFLGTTLCPCFVKAKLLRFSSPTKKNPHLFHIMYGQTGILWTNSRNQLKSCLMLWSKTYHFPTAISAELAVYRAVSAVAAPVLAVYNIRTSLIQRCISCISSDSIFWVNDVGEILAKHLTF